jgi:APA family basic amino acid/polyamine antiporter
MSSIISAPPRRHLLRILGVTFGVAVAVGDMIGSGILRAPNLIASTVPDVALIIGLWVLGAFDAALGVNVYAELATAIPRPGGGYDYVRRAFGDFLALVVGWGNWLAFVAGTAAAAISFANFLPLVWPWAQTHTVGVALAMLIALFGANILGLREGRVLQEITSLIKAVMLLVFCVAAAAFAPQTAPLPPSTAMHAFTLAAAVNAFQLIRGAYAGWDSPVYFGEEIVDTSRTIPRAMIMGLIFTAVLYVSVNGALLYAIGLKGVASSPLPFTSVLSHLGPIAALLFALTAMITVASCANANIMGGPRILYSMAEDGILPKIFESVNKGGSPVGAMVLTALFCFGLAASGAFTLVFELLATLNGMTGLIIVAALFWLRRKEPNMPRPFRALGYPFLPGLWLVIQIAMLVLFSISDRVGILFALALAAACIPFVFFKRSPAEPRG